MRDARVMLQLVVSDPFRLQLGITLQQLAQHLVGIGDHGPELEALEHTAVTSHAPMPKNDRATFPLHQ
jgi:hypothetical protein